MKTVRAFVLAGVLAASPAFAGPYSGLAGDTPNTGPEGTGNFVAGQTERYGIPVAGKPEAIGNRSAAQPIDKTNELGKTDK
jgi:hypothetical protein